MEPSDAQSSIFSRTLLETYKEAIRQRDARRKPPQREVYSDLVDKVFLAQIQEPDKCYTFYRKEFLDENGKLYTAGSNTFKRIASNEKMIPFATLRYDGVWVIGDSSDPPFLHYLDDWAKGRITQFPTEHLSDLERIFRQHGLHNLVRQVQLQRSNQAQWCTVL